MSVVKNATQCFISSFYVFPTMTIVFVGTAGSVCRCSGAVVVFDWCSHHDSFKKERLLPSTCSDEVFRSIANRHESDIKHICPIFYISFRTSCEKITVNFNCTWFYKYVGLMTTGFVSNMIYLRLKVCFRVY